MTTEAHRQFAASTSFISTIIPTLMGNPDTTTDTFECGAWEAGLSHSRLDNGYTVELDVISPSRGWNLALKMFMTGEETASNDSILQLNNKLWSVDTVMGQRWVAIPPREGSNRFYVDSRSGPRDPIGGS
jgi:hypothetical protein